MHRLILRAPSFPRCSAPLRSTVSSPLDPLVLLELLAPPVSERKSP